MVLISIHPFALRRLFLVILALAGFSALCFADPVMMAHRYKGEKAPTAVADASVTAAARTADLWPVYRSADHLSPIFGLTFDNGPRPDFFSLSENGQPHYRTDATPRLAATRIPLMTTVTD